MTGLCHAAGVVTRDVQCISQTHTMLALVSAGLGLALVPEAACSLGFEGVVLRPLRGAETTRAELHLVWRPDNPNPAVPVFRDLALSFAVPSGVLLGTA